MKRQWTSEELERVALARLQQKTDKTIAGRYAELVSAFAKYFAREQGVLPLNKGIILSGCTGCGKTTLFRLFYYANTNATNDNVVLFKWSDCPSIAMNYTDRDNGGVAALRPHFRGAALFDDLGAEEVASHYGNKADVMRQIIQERYKFGALTFITTNLTFRQIAKDYGERIASRLSEMCSWVDMGINEDYRR